jgi:signal peptidase I
VIELVVIVALAIGLALGIQAFVVKPFQIPSPSMEPTLDVGQRVLVNRIGLGLGGDPEIGDVVVFHPPIGAEEGNDCGVERPERKPGQACPMPTPDKADTNFIKRIVAGPGDTLSIENGIPIVNGEAAQEDFIKPCGGLGGCDFAEPITIPADHFFMMGDNRGQSDDSRYWGPVPRDWIIGEAFFTYWPIDKVGLF